MEPETFVANLKMLEWFHSGLTSLWVCCKQGDHFTLCQSDVLRLPIRDASVDGATCGFALRNLTELEPFFAEVNRVLKVGGRIGFLDVAEPENRFLNWGHHIYFDRIVPKVGALLSDKSAYSYLPKSVSYLPPHQEIVAMIEKAGFKQVERKLFAPGSAQLFTGEKAYWDS